MRARKHCFCFLFAVRQVATESSTGSSSSTQRSHHFANHSCVPLIDDDWGYPKPELWRTIADKGLRLAKISIGYDPFWEMVYYQMYDVIFHNWNLDNSFLALEPELILGLESQSLIVNGMVYTPAMHANVKLAALLTQFSIKQDQIEEMLLSSRNAADNDGKSGRSAYRKVACDWLRANELTWKQGCIVSFRVVSFSILAYSYSFRFVSFSSRIVSFRCVCTKCMKQLEYQRETKQSVWIDTHRQVRVGPQESGQRAGVGGGGAGRGRAGAASPTRAPARPRPAASTDLSMSINSNALFRFALVFQLFHTFSRFVRFCILSFRFVYLWFYRFVSFWFPWLLGRRGCQILVIVLAVGFITIRQGCFSVNCGKPFVTFSNFWNQYSVANSGSQ